METKDTNYKKVLKSNIILFLSYGILTTFIFMLLTISIKCALHGIFNTALSISLSLISGIIIFYLLRFVCRSSILETFSKTKLSQENSTLFLKKMNVFFIICMILSILICIAYLIINNILFAKAITQAYEKYEFISLDLADQIADKIRENYQDSLIGKVSSTIIIELSLAISFFSLIPYQKKLLSKAAG